MLSQILGFSDEFVSKDEQRAEAIASVELLSKNCAGRVRFMLEGIVKFTAELDGYDIQKTVVQWPDPVVNIVEFESKDGQLLEVAMTFSAVESKEIAIDAGRKIASSVVDRLAFELETSIGDPGRVSCDLRTIPGSIASEIAVASDSLSFFCKGVVRIAVGTARSNSIVGSLEAKNAKPDAALLYMYRSAIKGATYSDQFMCLYNVLLSRFSDDQKKVDSFIVREEPGVGQSVSPHTGKNETVYTRLRNEMAHDRGASFDNVRAEMDRHLGGLKTLAKKSLLLP